MHNLILCAVFKNESHILSEWIEHYLHRGIDHIYLVNDHSTDEFLPIIQKYSSKVTLFHNDIVTKEVGRQAQIYEKYFRPVLQSSKWTMILDLDEFMYSPTKKTFSEILADNDDCCQIVVDWLHFGSNGHEYQPYSVVSGFTKRANFIGNEQYYAIKSIFKSESIVELSIHKHHVIGLTKHFRYNDDVDLVINHYTLQSREFYLSIKNTRGDCDNWFDHNGYSRDNELFEKFDINDIEDLRLFEQNKHISFDKLSEEDTVTMVITSCNRPHLLDQTLESFVAMNTYPIKLTYLIDDSGVIGCNDAVIEKYKKRLNIVSIYNPKNIGQVESIDKVYSYVRTKWIFHCEEDWKFLQPYFIEKSMKVFRENPLEKIFTVWLRPHHCTSSHPIIKDSLNRGYFLMDKCFSYQSAGIVYTWAGITFNPGLRKTIDCLKFHPYSLCWPSRWRANWSFGWAMRASGLAT
jgi:glycosyltransferase involved in cell wall biosynthesis